MKWTWGLWKDISILDRYRIESRNATVWIVASPVEMSRDQPEIVGKTIEHGEHFWTVQGVESRRPMAPIRVGETIGLLVEPAAQRASKEGRPALTGESDG